MPRPSVAIGGISALALVAGSTLPSLLGAGRPTKKERVAYASAAHTQARTEAAVGGSWSSSAEHPATRASTQPPASTQHHASSQLQGTPAAAGNAVSHSARESSAPTVNSSGGAALASAASRKTTQMKLVSDRTGTVSPVVESVRQVQQRLGVDPVDGSYGAVTQQAVTQFQASHGLQANGVVSDATRSALGLGPGPTLHPEVTEAATGPATSAASTVTQESAASATTAVHHTGGVPLETVSAPQAQNAPPTHVTTPPTQVTTPPTHVTTPPTDVTTPGTGTTGTPGSTPSGPTGSVQSGVQKMVAAGNRIATRPYVYGGGHGSFNSRGYDCSGSVSYVLHAAGLLKSPEDSTELESYGRPGPGRYVTVYANSGHAFMTIQGHRFDTVAQAETGSRWSNHMTSTSGFVARHPTHY